MRLGEKFKKKELQKLKWLIQENCNILNMFPGFLVLWFNHKTCFFFLPTHLHYKISLMWFIMNVGGVRVMVSFGGSSPPKGPQCWSDLLCSLHKFWTSVDIKCYVVCCNCGDLNVPSQSYLLRIEKVTYFPDMYLAPTYIT